MSEKNREDGEAKQSIRSQTLAPIRFANNFNVLRLLAAVLVIISHSYGLSNVTGGVDPLERIIGPHRTLGWVGVGIFFAMSGYLIMGSITRSPDILRFAQSRILRIFPGLATCIILSTLALGLFDSSLSMRDFLLDRQTEFFVAGNISLLSIRFELPGVFTHNPISSAVNGSLWTLPYEVQCYIVIALASGLGALGNGRRVSAFIVIAWLAILGATAVLPAIGHSAFEHWLENFSRLGACFLVGASCAATKDCFRIKLWHWFVPFAVALILRGSETAFCDLALSIGFGLLTLWLAFLPNRFVGLIERMPDYSYGMYIYGFILQQLLLSRYPTIPPPLHAIIVCLSVLAPAGLSWHFIEKPALRLKARRSLGTAPNLA